MHGWSQIIKTFFLQWHERGRREREIPSLFPLLGYPGAGCHFAHLQLALSWRQMAPSWHKRIVLPTVINTDQRFAQLTTHSSHQHDTNQTHILFFKMSLMKIKLYIHFFRLKHHTRSQLSLESESWNRKHDWTVWCILVRVVNKRNIINRGLYFKFDFWLICQSD